MLGTNLATDLSSVLATSAVQLAPDLALQLLTAVLRSEPQQRQASFPHVTVREGCLLVESRPATRVDRQQF